MGTFCCNQSFQMEMGFGDSNCHEIGDKLSQGQLFCNISEGRANFHVNQTICLDHAARQGLMRWVQGFQPRSGWCARYIWNYSIFSKKILLTQAIAASFLPEGKQYFIFYYISLFGNWESTGLMALHVRGELCHPLELVLQLLSTRGNHCA